MTLEIRKMCKFVDTTYVEDFKKCDEPVVLVSVAAVIANPVSYTHLTLPTNREV